MTISAAILAGLTLPLALTPARAAVLYPTLPCRVFVDTDYTQIPDQCGTLWRSYPRRLQGSHPTTTTIHRELITIVRRGLTLLRKVLIADKSRAIAGFQPFLHSRCDEALINANCLIFRAGSDLSEAARKKPAMAVHSRGCSPRLSRTGLPRLACAMDALRA